MRMYFRSLLIAVVTLIGGSHAVAQTPADTLPCDTWLTTIATGAPVTGNWDVLFKIDGCERADSLIVAAREQGTRALLALGDAGSASLYIGYLARDSAWVANALVPMVLPIVSDKSNTVAVRGRMMLLLANTLQSRDAAVRSVYTQNAGEPPGSSARCNQGVIISETSGTRLTQSAIASITAAAQTIIADSTEVPQLREAARCLLRAANDPSR